MDGHGFFLRWTFWSDSCEATQNIQFIKDSPLRLIPLLSIRSPSNSGGFGLHIQSHPGCELRYIFRMDSQSYLLRHTLATLAYRTTRALENAPASFADFDGAGRRPVQILAHMGDLFDWVLSMAQGNPSWHNSEPLAWTEEEQRFFAALGAFYAFLASDSTLSAPIERLFQGPIADALTHTGQLCMLRRLAGAPIRGEHYYVAAIAVGQVGAAQPAPVQPFK
jgi:hypothetical protein